MTENTTPETTPAEEGRLPERQQPEAATPNKYQREQGLLLAVDVAKAHTDLSEPGTFVMVWADYFAAFLATGALPPALETAKRNAAAAAAAEQEEGK